MNYYCVRCDLWYSCRMISIFLTISVYGKETKTVIHFIFQYTVFGILFVNVC